MASYARERDEFFATGTKIGLSVEVIRSLLRYATTLQRLAEAQCNGDWPADNGERKVIACLKCEGGFVPSSYKWVDLPHGVDGKQTVPTRAKVCPDCRAQAHVEMLLKGTGYMPYFQGDPRGPVLKLYPIGTLHEDIHSGRARNVEVYVPAGKV